MPQSHSRATHSYTVVEPAKSYEHIQSTHLVIVSTCIVQSKHSTYHAQAQDHTAPEEHVIEQSPASDPFASLHHDNRHLQHHGEEAIAPKFPRDTAHDQLMRKRRDEKSDRGCYGTRHVVLRGRVDMASEEVMDRLLFWLEKCVM
jgi:hypothetical protein